jgi:hypothetical protein
MEDLRDRVLASAQSAIAKYEKQPELKTAPTAGVQKKQEDIPQTPAAKTAAIADEPDVTDEELRDRAVKLLDEGKTDQEIQTALLDEYEGIENDLPAIIKAAHVEFVSKQEKEIEAAHAFEDEVLKTAMEAQGRAQTTELELKKTKLDLHFTKKNKRIPSDLTENEVSRLSEEIQNDMSWLDETQVTPRPEFPRWVMEGTSLYTGLAKPISDVNSKYPELIWVPAVQLMLNFLHNKVHVTAGKEQIKVTMNMFLGEISDPGKFFKSSSCEVAQEYYQPIGLMVRYSPGPGFTSMKTKGKIIIGQASSSEGFGLAMSKVNAKHAIFFNDELSKLASKVGIENSSLAADMLSWYESREYSGVVKSDRQSFAFPAGSYCFGWQFCTTTRGFGSQWPRIAGIASGMPDRTFFLLAPKEPKPLTDEVYVNTNAGSIETKKLMDKAIADGGNIPISTDTRNYLRDESSKFDDPRSMNMVYTFALYFAVDLGLREITEDCVDRALALVRYRQDAVEFLQPIEAHNDEGRLQQEILREIRQHGGKMPTRELDRNLNANRHGARFWNSVYGNMLKADMIREFSEPGKRGQTRKMIGLVKDSYRYGSDED